MRSYLHQAILEAMKEADEPVMAHELNVPVSERVGIHMTSRKMGMQLMTLIEEGVVRKKVIRNGYAFYWLT